MKKEKILKLRFLDCKFNHLPNRVTECVIHFDINVPLYNKIFGTPSDKVKKGISGLGLEFGKRGVVARGYARCSDSDVYNEKIGRMIAESKAKKNAYRVGLRIGKILEKEVRRELIDIMRFNEQMFKCEACEREHTGHIESKL